MIAAELLKKFSQQNETQERRESSNPHFTLVQLDPRCVIHGSQQENGYFTEEITPAGTMREVCPHCDNVPLQLILRYKHVIRAHLLCPQCTRCVMHFTRTELLPWR